MTNVDEQIVKYLQFKPSAKVLELSSALNIEKRTIENTLSRLQANRKIRKASGKPDEWSLSNISKCKMYGPSGGGQSRGRGSGRPKGSSRYHNQQNQHNFRGERPLNKTYPELTQKIIELFQRKNCMLTSEILADLRLEKSLINRTLYGLEKKGILRKIAESPPKWCFTGTSNYSEKLVKNSLSKHFTIPHYLMNCRDHYADYQSGSNSNLNSAIEPYRYVPIDISCGSYNPGQLPQPSYGGRYQSHGHFDGYSETALHSTNSTGPFAVCDTVGVMPQSGPFGILGFNSSYPKHDLPCINSPNTYFSCESNVVSSEAVNYGLKNSGFSMPIINNADADFSFTTCLPAGEQPKNVDDQLLEKILLTLKGTKNCTVSVKELSEILHCSPNHIEYHLEILENKECVSRVAPDIWVLVGDTENFDGNNIGENSPASFVEVPTSGSSANGAYSSANFQPPLSPHELIASNPIYKYDSLTEKQNISYQSNAGYASEKDFTTTCPKAPFHFGDANTNIKSPEFSFNSTAVSVQGSSVASLEQKFKKTEISPQSEIDLQITPESFAVLNKNPISALMEYAQQRHLAVEFKLLSQRGPSHRPLFKIAVAIGKKVFPSVESGNKKDAKTDAAALALRILIAEGQYQMESGFLAPKLTMQFSEMTHFDRIAAMSHNAFNKLALKIPENLAGRKVLAALIMKTGADDEGIVISVGTGNRCLTGDRLSLEGNSVNDSHAEIITRRGFLRFLYKRLLEYEPVHSDLFEKVSVNKFKIKSNITFHLYISTAPCGDGALFSPRNADASNMKLENVNSVEHHPTFMSNAQGLLRTKVEGGEGTIPIEAGFVEQTWDGIQRGERLRTMSCSDKICRWNVVGLQGALLSQFLAPIYLDSITLGYLYDHGHLARAVCCRLDRGDPPINELLPEGYRLNHPWLGRVTACDPPRETQKTKSLSINWTIDDDRSEVLDGTEGICYTVIEKNLFSRITKQNMYGDFKCLCRKFNCPQLVASSYNKSKQLSRDFQMAKEVMLKKFHSTDCGTWVAKPVEEEMFA